MISSVGHGAKSKMLPNGEFYVCCDEGTVLGNKFKKGRSLEANKKEAALKKVRRNATVNDIAKIHSYYYAQTQEDIMSFENNIPENDIVKVINFCIEKGVRKIKIGSDTFPYDSNGYSIAEFISPTLPSFSLRSPIKSSPDVNFKNSREFFRIKHMSPPAYFDNLMIAFNEKFPNKEIS